MGLDSLLAKLSAQPATSATATKSQTLQLQSPLSLGCTSATPATSQNIKAEDKTDLLGQAPDAEATTKPGDSPALPPWCRSVCPSLEIIPGAGIGCVRRLPDGGEEWRALCGLAGCKTSESECYQQWMLEEADALERVALSGDPVTRAARLAVVVAIRQEVKGGQ